MKASGDGFEFRDIDANWPGGKIMGTADLGLTQPGLPFQIDLETEGLTGSHFVHPTVVPDAMTRAALDAEVKTRLHLQGFARVLDTVRGALTFEGLQVPIEPLISGTSLGEGAVQRAGALDFEIARVWFRLSQGAVVFDDVNFNADQVVIRALGSVSPVGEWNLAVRAYIPASALPAIESFTRGWPQNRSVHFNALENTSLIYRDVLMRGLIDEPTFDVWNEGTFRTTAALLDEIRALREEADVRRFEDLPAGAATDVLKLEPNAEPLTQASGAEPGDAATTLGREDDNG